MSAGRELCLLVFVAATSALSTDWIDPYLPVVQRLGGYWQWLVSIAAVVTTLLRRWLPGTVLVVAAAQFGLLPVSATVLAVTAYGATWRIRSRRRRISALVLVLPTAFLVAVAVSRAPWRGALAFHSVAAVVCVGVPALARIVVGQIDRLVRVLRERAYYLEENARLAGSAARLQERSRIAAEMHDQLGHRLSLISLHAGALELDTADLPTRGWETASLIRSTAQTAMDELRSALGRLPGPSEGPASHRSDEAGTWSDVAGLVDESRLAGIPVGLQWSGGDLGDVPLPIRQAVHRTVREGLTNVHRYAADADTRVAVHRGPDRLRVAVVNAPGPRGATAVAVRGTGHGLVGLEACVTVLGGRFTAGPTPQGGFHLAAELPTVCVIARPVPTGRPCSHRRPSALWWRPKVKERFARTQRWSTAGMSVVMTAGLAGIAALVVVLLVSIPGCMQAEPFNAATIGMRQADVVDLIGGSDPAAQLAARSLESPRPPGSICVYGFPSDPDNETIQRYCFRDGRLVAKNQFTIPAN